MAWLCSSRCVLVDQVDLEVADLAAAAQVVLAHQAVEVDRRGRAGIGLVVGHLGQRGQVRAQLVRTARGALHRRAGGHVHHHLELGLVVEGQHLQLHQAQHRQQQRAGRSARPRPRPAATGCAAAARVEQRREDALNSGASLADMPCGCLAAASAGRALIRRRASHGVTTKATASDSSMPMLALMGIGLMYGPIRPLTKAIGSSAAMTVNVARMVGPPTSSTAPGMICTNDLPGYSCCVR